MFAGERLVLIEDAAELNPVHPHVVSLESRHGNLEGGGAVDLGELVRQSLRMRPDRLVVGECRGAEVRELLSAMNTGHSGGGGTIHANTAADVPARLTALGALAGMGQDAVRLQVASAIDVVVHVERLNNGRTVACIGVLEDSPAGLVVGSALDIHRGAVRAGPAWPILAGRLGLDPGGLDRRLDPGGLHARPRRTKAAAGPAQPRIPAARGDGDDRPTHRSFGTRRVPGVFPGGRPRRRIRGALPAARGFPPLGRGGAVRARRDPLAAQERSGSLDDPTRPAVGGTAEGRAHSRPAVG